MYQQLSFWYKKTGFCRCLQFWVTLWTVFYGCYGRVEQSPSRKEASHSPMMDIKLFYDQNLKIWSGTITEKSVLVTQSMHPNLWFFFVCFCYHGPQFFLSVFFRPHPPSAIRRYPVRFLQTPFAVCCSFSMSCPECSWISLEWSLPRLFSVVCLRLYYSRWKSGLI